MANYSPDFIDRAKSAHPNWPQFHRLLDRQDPRAADCLTPQATDVIATTRMLSAVYDGVFVGEVAKDITEQSQVALALHRELEARREGPSV